MNVDLDTPVSHKEEESLLTNSKELPPASERTRSLIKSRLWRRGPEGDALVPSFYEHGQSTLVDAAVFAPIACQDPFGSRKLEPMK